MASNQRKENAPNPSSEEPGAKPALGPAREEWEVKATREMLVRCLLNLAADPERAAFEVGAKR
jgi:hypothetical protein